MLLAVCMKTQIIDAYSKAGFAKLYNLILVKQECMLQCKNPLVVLAFIEVALMWSFQIRLGSQRVNSNA